ncbi:MAG TPA: Pvc16 family protein [Solirubrobacteraceae bacterium]|nr:Pvc16 family protein [Solirubrobacteraceae bacterium]
MAERAVVDVPRTNLLADVDEAVRALLDAELDRSGLADVTITFDAPTRERSSKWSTPAINLFLYDVREAGDALDRSWHATETNGQGALVRAPLRLACTYAVTAWTLDVLEEHRILSQVIAVLYAHPQLPKPPELADGAYGEFPWTTRVAHGRSEDGRPDFWTAIGSAYKLSVEYAVTVVCDPGVSVPRARGRVRGVAIDEQATYVAAGLVVDSRGKRVAGASVEVRVEQAAPRPPLLLTALTGADGTFVLSALPGGVHDVVARSRDGREARDRLAVPGGGVTLALPDA